MMETVFLSSIQRDYSDVRDAAAAAVESLGMHVLRAETTGASPSSPQRALLDEVGRANYLLLLVGSRYGVRGDSGFSPTEDEVREAERLNIPVIALVQDTERDEDQQEFLDRLRGNWENGRLSGSFTGPSDVGLEVVRAFAAHQRAATTDPQAESLACERALQFAAEDDRRSSSSGSKARAVFVPVGTGDLLTAVELNDPAYADRLAGLLRSSGLVSQAAGISSSVSADGVRFESKEEAAWETLRAAVLTDGTILAEWAVGADAGMLAGMQVAASKFAAGLERAQRFALDALGHTDSAGSVRRIAVTTSIPEASMKTWTEADPGNSPSSGFGMPAVAVAPNPPLVVGREELGMAATNTRIVAEMKRAFIDNGAVHPR